MLLSVETLLMRWNYNETDPAARFDMMTDAIKDAGLSFDDMSYYQKKFAESMDFQM